MNDIDTFYCKVFLQVFLISKPKEHHHHFPLSMPPVLPFGDHSIPSRYV